MVSLKISLRMIGPGGASRRHCALVDIQLHEVRPTPGRNWPPRVPDDASDSEIALVV